MAGADYINCASEDPNCKGHKLIYAGHVDYENRPKVYCACCYEKLEAENDRLKRELALYKTASSYPRYEV